jgi:hypothetical protein
LENEKLSDDQILKIVENVNAVAAADGDADATAAADADEMLNSESRKKFFKKYSRKFPKRPNGSNGHRRRKNRKNRKNRKRRKNGFRETELSMSDLATSGSDVIYLSSETDDGFDDRQSASCNSIKIGSATLLPIYIVNFLILAFLLALAVANKY